jgi:hypothetical protein
MHRRRWARLTLAASASLVAGLVIAIPAGTAQAAPAPNAPQAQTFTVNAPAAFDVSPPLRELAKLGTSTVPVTDLLAERGPVAVDKGHSTDGALQSSPARHPRQDPLEQISEPRISFEGTANATNPRLVSPPDPDGDVGPNHYVQMVNVQFEIYDKVGNTLVGPAEIGTLFAGFPVADCAGFNGDPIVEYDHHADRWLLTQFTIQGPEFWNCIAISTSPDPTGTYFRYAFSTGENFPDYPKYGVWPDSYFIATREFAPDDTPFIGAYALEKRRMLVGDPNARAVSFVVPLADRPFLLGDGLLPTDWEGDRAPRRGTPNWFVGTQDDGGPYGAPFDALNIWEFNIEWRATPRATFGLASQIPVAEFDSIFPCAPTSRHCIDQPTTTNKIDILSYRQRPTWRLSYRNFGGHASLVTNQSVEARPGMAGVRWYELRSVNGQTPTLFQQGTFAPDDGVHRWMGSIAQDKNGNMAVGYSVSNATDVFPGIRYTGRLAGDPAGVMARGERTLIAGSGAQLTSQRWGDYTAMHIDPVDNCTFWYTNQYYAVSSPNGWQTRIGSFKFPSCRF